MKKYKIHEPLQLNDFYKDLFGHWAISSAVYAIVLTFLTALAWIVLPPQQHQLLIKFLNRQLRYDWWSLGLALVLLVSVYRTFAHVNRQVQQKIRASKGERLK